MDGIPVSINGRDVTVPEGSTILDASTQEGIGIPTLCHSRELLPRAPAASAR